MSKSSFFSPAYGLHKATGQARVILSGKHVYLGAYGSPESWEKYHRFTAEWLATGQVAPNGSSHGSPNREITINELILAFWTYAKSRYVKHGKPTSEQNSFRTALRPVCQLYGSQPVSSFGPLALSACRQQLVEADICRKRVNQHVGRIRQVFKWGVSQEMVPETVWRALCTVRGLRLGEARETQPIRPVPEEHIPAVQPFVTPPIWAMINVQLWSGCRPGEACEMRTIDVDMRGDVWEFRPASHKTQHHDKERVIYLGPQAQEVLRPWIKSDPHAPWFSPKEGRDWYNAQRAEAAKRRRSSKSKRSQRSAAGKRLPRDRYDANAYGHAVANACERAGIPKWAPNRLRHNAGTRIRAAYGIEASRVILGHASAVTSEIYAEMDRNKAREISAKLG